MNRSDIVNHLATQFTHLTQHDAELCVTAIVQALNNALTRRQRIEVRGFGTFKVTHRPSRVGRNPRTGEPIQVPSKRAVHFKVGKALRLAVEERSIE
jgi:integration host factor subunit beta